LRCPERNRRLVGATGDEERCGERDSGDDTRTDCGGQGGARLTDGQGANNAVPLNRRGSSRTLLRCERRPQKRLGERCR
jgi:hypothetical protein